MRSRNIILLLTAVMMLASSCERRVLSGKRTEVMVEIDVNTEILNAPGAVLPETMHVNLYDTATGESGHTDYISPTGGTIHAIPGTYDFIVYSFGLESTQVRNERQYNEVEAYTNEVSAFLKSQLSRFLARRAQAKAERERAKAESGQSTKSGDPETSAPGEKIVYEPDHIFVGHAHAVEIPAFPEDEEGMKIKVEIEAETVVETWKIAFDNVEGLEWVSSTVAIISGQAGSHYLGRQEDSEDAVSIYFEMDTDKENGRIIGEFNTFGKHPDVESTISLDVNLTDTYGNEQSFHFELDSEMMDNQAGSITIEEPVVIEEPTSGGGGGGFVPTVDEWDEIRKDIIL